MVPASFKRSFDHLPRTSPARDCGTAEAKLPSGLTCGLRCPGSGQDLHGLF